MPFFEQLEQLYVELEHWQLSSIITKEDVLKSVRLRLATIFEELLTAPQIGTAFSHPSDRLVPSNVEYGVMWFEPDTCVDIDDGTVNS